MSSSETKVRVASADPFAEVSLVDAHYRVRASGLGSIEKALPPGLYVARARSGDVTRQQSLRIGPDSPEEQNIHFGEVGPLRSSAPVEPSGELEMVAQSAAAPANQGWVLLALSAGAGPDPSTSGPPLSSDAARGFALCTLDGKEVQDLASLPPTLTPTGHQVVATAAKPGWYALAIPADEGRRILLPLRIQAQWSPSVFLEMRRSGDELRPNLDTMLVSYDPAEWGIYRNPTRLRAMEQARRALARGRGEAAPEVMRVLFDQKYEDPMLGLMAIALLLAAGEPSSPLAEVLEHTGRLLGHDHPDLVISRAVARRDRLVSGVRRKLGDGVPLVAPPLLRASWELLLGLRERKDELLDRDGPLYRVTPNQVRSDIWMLWWETPAVPTKRRASSKTSRRRAPARVAGSADALLAQLMEKLGGGKTPDPSALQAWYREHRSTLTPVERSVLRACIQLAQQEPGRPLPKGFASRLAQAAEVPLPVLKEALVQLLGRIEG